MDCLPQRLRWGPKKPFEEVTFELTLGADQPLPEWEEVVLIKGNGKDPGLSSNKPAVSWIKKGAQRQRHSQGMELMRVEERGGELMEGPISIAGTLDSFQANGKQLRDLKQGRQ